MKGRVKFTCANLDGLSGTGFEDPDERPGNTGKLFTRKSEHV
jgi:hypothetical protein